MNSSGIILFIVIIAISIYDFYILNKSKVKITSCLSSSIITLFFNLILLTIGLLLGKQIFGIKNNYWVIISLILIISISYFRFIGRKNNENKKSEKIKPIKKLTPKEEQIEEIKSSAGIGGFVAILTSIYLFFIKKDNSLDYYLLFLDPVLIGILAYWTYKKLSFVGCLLMTCLFIIGKLAFIVPIFEAGGRMGGAGLGMSIIFGYFLIKGTISAFKYNYQK
jgi:positive regulator of sigma E activity